MRRLMLENKNSAFYPQKIIAEKSCVNMNEIGTLLEKYVDGTYTVFILDKMPDEKTPNNQFLNAVYVNGFMKTAIRYRDGSIASTGISAAYDAVINAGDTILKYVINL